MDRYIVDAICYYNPWGNGHHLIPIDGEMNGEHAWVIGCEYCGRRA